MNDNGFVDDEIVPIKKGDVTKRVGKKYLVDIVRVNTDLALSVF